MLVSLYMNDDSKISKMLTLKYINELCENTSGRFVCAKKLEMHSTYTISHTIALLHSQKLLESYVFQLNYILYKSGN